MEQKKRASPATINVYVKAGQSNNLGGSSAYKAETADGFVRLFAELGRAGQEQHDYPPASDPNTPRWLQRIERNAHSLSPIPFAGRLRSGPEISFGRLLFKHYGAAHNAVIAKFAIGGSSLGRHWMRRRPDNLSDRFIRFLEEVRQVIEANGDTFRISAFTWLQGESDAARQRDADAYQNNLSRIVKRVRDFAENDGLPVAIGRTHIDVSVNQTSPFLETVRAAQEAFVTNDRCAALINVDDLLHNGSGVHFRPEEYSTIGIREFEGLMDITKRSAPSEYRSAPAIVKSSNAPPKNLTIHIGTHKTGSSAIQKFCDDHRAELLTRGTIYPHCRIHFGHHDLAWALAESARHSRDRNMSAEEIAADILAQARGVSNLLISSEDFEFLDTPAIERLRSLFSGPKTTILVYVRRQDSALFSVYGQRIKGGVRYSGTLSELAKMLKTGRFDYWQLANRWAQVFGPDAIRVRPYERARFPGGNVVPDFLQTAGIEPSGFVGHWPEANKSLHPLTLEVLRRLNASIADKEQRLELIKKIQAAAARYPRTAIDFATEKRREYFGEFSDSNRRVAETWLGCSDLFLEPITDEYPTFDTALAVEELLGLAKSQ